MLRPSPLYTRQLLVYNGMCKLCQGQLLGKVAAYRHAGSSLLHCETRAVTGLTTHRFRYGASPKWHQTAFHRSLNSWTQISRRELAHLEELLQDAVGLRVRDPILKHDLKSLQWFHGRIAISQDGTTLQLLLRMPSLLHPSLSELKNLVKTTAEERIQDWLAESGHERTLARVNVEAVPNRPLPLMSRFVESEQELVQNIGPGLSNISHFLAVYSCKGGVGKSTVAVNLAYELARMGGRVGLVDLDIYGPSLPILVKPLDTTIRRSTLGSGMVYPIDHHGVKLLSLGFVSKDSGVPGSGANNGAAIMRGPMAGRVVAQLLKGTDWGELDVLILDLPPGTGDVQLSVLQELQLSGAVAVTTPSKLALADTRKGIEMFTSLGVQTLVTVENMAYFRCDGCEAKHYPFGQGFALSENRSGMSSVEVVQLPISSSTHQSVETALPLSLVRPDDAAEELAAFESLAKIVSRGLFETQYGLRDDMRLVMFGTHSDAFELSTMNVSLDKDQLLMVKLYSDSGALQKRLNPSQLRSRDPKTGDRLSSDPLRLEGEEEVELTGSMVKKNMRRSPSVIPAKVTRRGHYGYGIEWGDGATIIYSMASIAKAAGGILKD